MRVVSDTQWHITLENFVDISEPLVTQRDPENWTNTWKIEFIFILGRIMIHLSSEITAKFSIHDGGKFTFPGLRFLTRQAK